MQFYRINFKLHKIKHIYICVRTSSQLHLLPCYILAGNRVCVWCRESSGVKEESMLPCQMDRRSLEGIGRWKLTGSSEFKHCHGKWIAQSDDNKYDVCSDRGTCRNAPILSFV